MECDLCFRPAGKCSEILATPSNPRVKKDFDMIIVIIALDNLKSLIFFFFLQKLHFSFIERIFNVFPLDIPHQDCSSEKPR